jgi:hypothetical protein
MSNLNINHLQHGDVLLLKLPPKLKEQLYKLQKQEHNEARDQDQPFNKE